MSIPMAGLVHKVELLGGLIWLVACIPPHPQAKTSHADDSITVKIDPKRVRKGLGPKSSHFKKGSRGEGEKKTLSMAVWGGF